MVTGASVVVVTPVVVVVAVASGVSSPTVKVTEMESPAATDSPANAVASMVTTAAQV